LSSECNDHCAAFIAALVVLVVPVGHMAAKLVVVFVVEVILKEVVGSKVMSLANALIVAIVIIQHIIVEIDMANHLGLPIRFLSRRILQPHMDSRP
jgi:hypothetical protein